MKCEIKFFPNTKDNTHCYQACLRSVLKVIYPDKNFTYKQLDKLCKKPKNKWTWPFVFSVYMKNKGFHIKIFSLFDFNQFAKNGYEYIRNNYTKEIADTQIRMSNIDSEMENAREMLKYNIFEKRKINLKGIEKFFIDGWFIIANINPYVLNNKKGYAGHAVLIVGMDKNNICLHDPGLPPIPNRKVTKKVFMKALRYTSDSEIYLIKP